MREIGQVAKCSAATICESAKTLKDEIAAAQMSMMRIAIPLVQDTALHIIKAAHWVASRTKTDPEGNVSPDLPLIKENKDLLALADRKAYRLELAAGIIPSHTQPIVMQYLDQRTQIAALAPELAMFQQHLLERGMGGEDGQPPDEAIPGDDTAYGTSGEPQADAYGDTPLSGPCQQDTDDRQTEVDCEACPDDA